MTEQKFNPFQKAVKIKSKMRCAMFGISGSGKTYTSLAISTGLGGKTAFIDTEHGSASKYADRFTFDVLELEKPFTVEKYIDAIQAAQDAGYNNLIIDSLSHCWQEILEEVDKLANAKYKGNPFRAWSEGTPKQKKFIEAILSFDGHIIATMRSNTDYVVEEGGKSVKRVGLKAEQGKNIEYEFDILMEMTEEHLCHVKKDRTSRFQDRILEKPGKEFGEELIAWLNEGAADKPKPKGNFPKACEAISGVSNVAELNKIESNIQERNWSADETKQLKVLIDNKRESFNDNKKKEAAQAKKEASEPLNRTA